MKQLIPFSLKRRGIKNPLHSMNLNNPFLHTRLSSYPTQLWNAYCAWRHPTSCYTHSSKFAVIRSRVQGAYNFVNNLKRLFCIHGLKFISFRFPRLKHHDLQSAPRIKENDLEILGYLSVLLCTHNRANKDGRGFRIAGFVHSLLI